MYIISPTWVYIPCSVKPAGAEGLYRSQTRRPFYLETLDVELTYIGGTGGRLAICLLVNRPQGLSPYIKVLNVRKNEIKIAAFDVLSLHR